MIRKFIAGLMVLFIASLLFFTPVYAIDFKAEEVFNSVVVVYSGNSMGSGFAIGNNLIMTNAHVVKNPNNVTAAAYKDTKYPVKVLCVDASVDIAVLELQDKSLPYLKIADYNNMSIGDDVYAVGAPENMEYTLTKGILSAKDRMIGGFYYLQTDAPINPGNSGGPLLNKSGEVIGMNTMKLNDSEGIGLSIPMTTVSEFLKKNNINIDEQDKVIGDLAEKSKDNINSGDKPTNFNGGSDQSQLMKLKNENFYLKIGIVLLILLELSTLLILIFTKRKSKFSKQEHLNTDDYDFDIDIQE